MKIRVAFVFSNLVKGGAEKLITTVANALIVNGFEVDIISLGSPKDYSYLKIAPEIKIHHFPRNSKFDFGPAKQIKEFYVANPISFFCCVDFFTQLYMSVIRKFYKLKYRLVLSQHTTIPLRKIEWLNSLSAGMLIRKTDMVVHSCINQQNYVEKNFLKFEKVPSVLIYNGIDFSPYHVPSQDEKAKLKKRLLGIEPEIKVVLKAAGFRMQKDHLSAINALAYYRETFAVDIHLLFLGDTGDSYVQTLIAYVTEKKLTAHVTFKEFQVDMAPYLNAADIFTLTSSSVETFSLSAIAGLAAGLPIVLTDIGGANEMINENNGVLTKPCNPKHIAESWHKAITKNYNFEQIRKEAAEIYDLKRMCDSYVNSFYKFTVN